MRPRTSRRTRCAVALLACLACGAAAAQQPIEVLREHVERGIELLTDARYRDASLRAEQREKLCALTREIFDPFLFSRLALGSRWSAFDAGEQAEFVEVFESYLCAFYLGQLQERYAGERVVFLGQELKSESAALVRLEIEWRDKRIPVEIRMALRDGRWRAFDAVVMGVSVLRVYRAQLSAALAKGSPAKLIRELRSKAAGNG